jgi:hypothetical protein
MTDATPSSSAPDDIPPFISGDEFRDQFGEDLADTLDLGTWQQGADLAGVYSAGGVSAPGEAKGRAGCRRRIPGNPRVD